MPSELLPAQTPSRWTLLRSQGLGVCCGLATTLLLAVGSVVLAATSDGASAAVRLDDVRAFLRYPSLAHLWLYLLLPVLGLYGLNTFLATWHSVATKWRNGVRQPQAYAAAVLHVAFLVALAAHLVGGLQGREEQALIDGRWRALPDGREVRMLDLDVDRLPGGMPRNIRANVEIREPGGETAAGTIGFNEPLSDRVGTRLVLLQRPIVLPSAAVLRSRGRECTLRPTERCTLAGHEIELLDVRDSASHGPMAQITSGKRTAWLVRGFGQSLGDGTVVTLLRVERGPGAVVSWRHAPGNSWALVSALLLTLGITLMWRRLL